MKTFKLFFNIIFSIITLHTYLFCGFGPDTLVLTPNGYVAIQDIKKGDIVVSVTKEGSPSLTEVLHTVIKPDQKHIQLTISQCTRYRNLKNEINIADQTIIVAHGQKFFRMFDHAWTHAKNIETDTTISAATSPSIAKITKITEYFNGVTLYDLNLKEDHAFCVTNLNVVAHNCGILTVGWFNCAASLANFAQAISGAGFAGALATLLNVAAPAAMITSAVVFAAMEVAQSQAVDIAAAAHSAQGVKNSNSVHTSKTQQQTPNIKGPDKDPDDDDDWEKQHPHGRYVQSPKHHKNSKGNISNPPRDGQTALDNSFEVPGKNYRIAIEDGKIIQLMKDGPKRYHGYIVENWHKLDSNAQKVLRRNGYQINPKSGKWKK